MSAPVTIDCQYLGPQFAAAFLLVENGRAAFVENNTAHAHGHLMAALEKSGVPPEAVDYVIITHVHLDHASGSAQLMAACPNATLLAHPRAAPHVIDPSKLVASARKVYGDAEFARLYGDVGPVPEHRVRIMQDNEELTWGSRRLKFLHTRGHANHHFCVLDSGSQGIFTGDAFGLRYPVLQSHGLFTFPSTSPTDFDPAEARAAVRRIAESGARSAYLTHFGQVTELQEAAQQLLMHLDVSDKILQDAVVSDVTDEGLDGWCMAQLREHFTRTLDARGMPMTPQTAEILKLDIDLNGQGIAHTARKRRHPKV